MRKLFHFGNRRRPGLPIFDASGWYVGWYFEHRLQEEVARAKRYGMTFTLLYLLIDDESAAAGNRRRDALSNLLDEGFRRSDLPAKLSENEFAVILTNTDVEQAVAVQDRLQRVLDEFHPAVALASYPEDSREPDELLTLASHRALASTDNPERAIFARRRGRGGNRRSA